MTIRFSDHNGNARNIIIMGKKSDIGYSFVVRTPNTATEDVPFKANKWANVLEFVYKDPSMERLEQIAKGIFDLVDNGEYTDLAGADEIHPSPRIGDEETNAIGTRLSLRQHNRQPGQIDMRAANLYEQMLSGRWSQIDEAWHDDLVSVRRLQEALEQATGRKVRDYENVYLNAVHKSSKNKVMMDRLVFDLVDPMIDAVKAITSKHLFDQDEVEQYLNCKHGLERNQVLAQRKADEAMANDEKRSTTHKECAPFRLGDIMSWNDDVLSSR